MKAAKLTTVLALILFGTLVTSSAMAATANLQVTALVQSACQITAGTLDFGTLDPLNAVDVSVTNGTAATVTCNTNEAYTITDDGGLHGGNLSDGTNQIAYTLTYTGTGTGNGSAQDVSITGDIVAGAYANKPSGTYTDTVQLTVTP